MISQTSTPSTVPSLRELDADELRFRRAILARFFRAWHQQRPDNPAETLGEYVNATRAVGLTDLNAVVHWVIAAGGEWMPSPGDVMRRAYDYFYRNVKRPPYNPNVTHDQRLKELVARDLRSYEQRARHVMPVGPGAEATAERMAIVGERPRVRQLVDGVIEGIESNKDEGGEE